MADEHNSYHIKFLSQIAVKGHKMPHSARVSGIIVTLTERGEKYNYLQNRANQGSR